MIDQALACENRVERSNLAKAIIGVMGNMNPHLRDVPEFQHKLWDQLFIMSDFALEIERWTRDGRNNRLCRRSPRNARVSVLIGTE